MFKKNVEKQVYLPKVDPSISGSRQRFQNKIPMYSDFYFTLASKCACFSLIFLWKVYFFPWAYEVQKMLKPHNQ